MKPHNLAAAFGLILAIAAVRWAPELLGLRDFYAEDVQVLNVPLRDYCGQELARGRLMLWSPHLQGGFPLFAESQAGELYPLHWLHALPLRDEPLLAWAIVLHLAWFGAGICAWLMALGLRREAALLPAVAAAFSSLLLVRHQHTNVLEALAWWPWVLAAIELGLRGSSQAWLAAGLAAGLMSWCGHAQYVLSGFCLAGAYAIGRAIALGSRGWLGPAAIGAAVGCGMAAAQYVPLLELSRHSIRAAGLGVWEQGEQALRLQHLPLLLAPGFWGAPFTSSYAGPKLAWEQAAYLGALPLLLALVGVCHGARLRWLGIGLAVLGLWLALGSSGGLWTLLTTLPGWDAARAPARMLALYGLGTLLLAGLGLQAVLDGRVHWSRRWGIVAASLLVALALAAVALPPAAERFAAGVAPATRWAMLWLLLCTVASLAWLRRAVSGAPCLHLAVALVTIDLLVAGWTLTPAQRPQPLRPPRVNSVAVPPGRAGETDVQLRPMSNLRWRVANLYNMSPLSLARQVELQDRAHAAAQPSLALARLWQMMGVQAGIGLGSSSRLRSAPFQPAPRIHAAGRPAEARHIAEPRFDPLREVILSDPVEPTWFERARADAEELEQPSLNRFAFRTESEAHRLWIIQTTPYPGWRAYIDGRPARLREANWIQSAVVTEAGEHTIVLVFESQTIRLGLFAALLAFGLLAGAWAVGHSPTLKRGAGDTKPAGRAGLVTTATGFNRWTRLAERDK